MRIGKPSSKSTSKSSSLFPSNSNSKSAQEQNKQDKYGLNKDDKYGLKENKYKKFAVNKTDNFESNKEESSSGRNKNAGKSPFQKLLNKSPDTKPMAPMAMFVAKKKSASLQWFFAPNNLLATFFGVGYIKYAPGTFASLATFPLYFLIKNQILDRFALSKGLTAIFWSGLIFFLFMIGGYFADIYSNKIQEEDPKQVVIDEVVGQLATIAIASYSKISDSNLNLLLCFLLFRLFDITKPFFIGMVDENIGGGYGTMLDDFLAAFCAGGLILLIGLY